MASISSLGVGSGIDIPSLVQSLVDAERTPALNRFAMQESKLQAKLSSYGIFKGALSSFQSSLTSLRSASFGQSKVVSVGNGDLFTATASTIASAGSYAVEVKQLAQSHSIATASGAYASVTDVVGTGTLTFSFGSYENDDDTGAFTQNADKAPKTVEISADDQTLEGVRDAVNAANIGVQASLINDGNGYRLTFASTDSGAENALELTVTEDPAASGLADLTYTADVKNMTRTAEAQDAIVSINGLDVTRSTNTVSEAIHGVTLQLKKADVGSPTQVTVAESTSSMRTAIEKFVAEFNLLQETINASTGYNAETKQAGVLLGDSMVRSVAAQMRQIVGGAVSGASSEYQALVDIGVSTQRNGTLSLDTSKLDAALSQDPAAVGRLFGATGTPTEPGVTYVSSTSATRAGEYALYVDQLAQHGSYTGVASSELDFTANPTSFAVKVDGVTTETLNITAQLYDSTTDIAAELQRQINSDANLKDKGITVSVTYEDGGYVITSGTYGSNSNVTVSTSNATLGLSGGTAVAGVDVSGTLGGLAFTGSGQRITGSGDAAGLSLIIDGTETGNRGRVVFSRGIADSLNSYLSTVLSADGLVAGRSAGIESQLDDIDEQLKKLDTRLSALQSRLTQQFIAMDQIVAQLRSTGDYLQQQLAALPGSSSNK